MFIKNCRVLPYIRKWKSSLACSHVSELIRELGLSINQLQFAYSRLNNLVKPIENHTAIRRYFESKKLPLNILSNILHETKSIYKSLVKKKSHIINENDQKGHQILKNLIKMNDYSIDIFHHLFFNSNEYIPLNNNNNDNINQQTNSPINEDNILESSPMIQVLRNKLSIKLEDWFSFIEIKSQRNITMSFCHNDFPGLVHFALIDRLRGHICTPALYTDDNQHHLMTNNNINEMEQFLEKKIINFELDCLSALQRGCTSYTMTDEHFTYNYTLRLQESNGASMRIYKPFVKSQPPGILHYDFYKELASDNYSSIVDQASLVCLELICVHLRIVPSSIVREQCEQLWPRLMELDE
ncbi:unnamed protein product [Rotaria sp. Silwood2]|nr:unnamed protein product [Rotaria sp. Silwood2]